MSRGGCSRPESR
eukprot:gene27384-biopygen17886